MTALVLSSVFHAAAGVLLAIALWTVGLGLVLLLRGRSFDAAETVHAYTLGVLAATAVSALALAGWAGAPFAIALAAAPLAVVAVRRAQASAAVAGLRSRVLVPLAPAAAFALTLGLLFHGPSVDRSTAAYPDLLFYVSKLVSASRSLVPLRDLLVAGERGTYGETAPTLAGAALADVPRFDPFLFHAAALPAFFAVSVLVGVALVAREVPAPRSAWLLGVLLAAALPYATWIVETPPAAMALPLAFSAYMLWRRPLPLATFAALAVALTLAFAATKVLGLLPFAALVAVAGYRDHLRRADGRIRLLAVGGALGLAGATAAAVLANAGWLAELVTFKDLPADALDGLREQADGLDASGAGLSFALAGEVALAAALARTRSFAILAALIPSLLGSWFVAGYGFDVGVALAVVLTVAHLRATPGLLERSRSLVAAAASLLVVGAVLRELAGTASGLVLMTLLAWACVLSVTDGGIRTRVALVAAPAAAALLAMGLVRNPAPPAATAGPDDFRVWREVAERTPGRALVFTSLTGPRITVEQGWNYYPGVAGRQVYLGGWFYSSLQVRDGEREARLARNRAVLDGRVQPRAVASGPGASYFAVVRRSDRVPPSFSRLYANDSYALYRIRS